MSTPTSTAEAAAQLKAEGNALFGKKDYSGAYAKYTQAISLDDKNAVLYCNRSACSLALGRRLDAGDDAEKATQLDPGYAKAWARLASAYMATASTASLAVASLQKALSALPQQDTSPATQRQRAEYVVMLESASKKVESLNDEAIARAQPWIELAGVDEAKLPWNLATAALPSLRREGKWDSSAWLVSYARRQWEIGVNLMAQLKVTPGTTEDVKMFAGQPGCVEHLCNAVLSDRRVFKFMRVDHNIGRFTDQLRFETVYYGGWQSGGSRRVIQEASQRLETGGIASVREPLAITIRGWIVAAWIEAFYMGALEHALDLYTAALEVLQWGMKLWKDLEVEERVLVFQEAIVRGVKCLRLETFTEAYIEQPALESRYPLEEVLAGAEDLLDELLLERETPLGEEEYSLFMGFVRYQLAQAHAFRGFYYHHSGRNIEQTECMSKEVVDDFNIAAKAYLEAARIYPEDDEHHVWSLYYASNILFDTGRPAGELLDMFNRIHDAIPKMKSVWEIALHTSISEREDGLRSCTKWRDEILSSMEHGPLTRNSIIKRQPIAD